MAAACEITAAEFLQGAYRQKLVLPRCSLRQTNRLLGGSLPRKSPSVRISRGEVGLRPVKVRAVVSRDIGSPVSQESKLVGRVAEKVVHFYRIPLIQESATAELLKLVQTKVSNQIIGLKTEQCFNIGVNGDISSEKLSVLRWLLGETYEPDNLGTIGAIEKVHVVRRPGSASLSDSQIAEFAALVHDRMTECIYNQKLTSFETNVVPEEVRYIPVMEKGRKALEEINEEMGLAFDEQDLKYYTKLFMDDIQRNPTNVELFDIAQSNSEHSRHWFFTGLTCPLDMSARDLDILFTAETHNFPCAVAPYPGAETGAGGRIRDTHATGRGSFVVASTAGNGASDYGNKFGEPLIQGYTRTFGMRLPSGERREWLKPIMFSGGIGQIDHNHIVKGEPEIGMLVVKIGGPAYRIGMGGGAASSMVSGQNDAELDFNAVQRGDAEMAQKLYRVVRACVEMGEKNPIISIHDRAGGNCNVVKEIISKRCNSNGLPPPPPAVDLELEKVLGDMPQKTFEFRRIINAREPLDIAPGITVMDSLKRVLRLPSVASKRFLTTKVDRCVTVILILRRCMLNWGAADKGAFGSKSYGKASCRKALTNLCVAKITSLSDVKASGNWMYAAKLDGEGAAMYDAAIALSEAMIELGIAIDGGKDSLSMAAHASGEVVKAPGNLVFDQVGDECPDLDDVSYLKRVFNAVQNLIEEELISAGHDISDGGLLEKLLEVGVSTEVIGEVTASPVVELKIDGITHLTEETSVLRDLWEETSFQLEKFQRLASCVELERKGLRNRHEPSWVLTFTPTYTDEKYMTATSKPKVAIIREEGSNGDREMSGAFYAAGFEPWDITMSDLLNGAISLHEFRGIAFWRIQLCRCARLCKRLGSFNKLMALLGWVPGPNVGGVLGTTGIHHSQDLAPVKYCDDNGNPTEVYPFNLNGSPLGVAAICSPDGRHLAMMPHPERCFLMWQYPWYPKNWNVEKKGPSPWLRMFQKC
ncbi:UNVERIFIED_CONTAM: putative phosphoribosylformylglycinamidine synthase, chloroplastic/mitochondrial [Sesamum radiatum]|uniref:Phosphoribosylformylglycinamidine synthase, chloroplastic/mitochondrial n=1 Tax=Sesamum radiatum TaxID=300843 RepID=A0AAW2W113_SESRA